jgi:putative GTP pyrophosphokinase
VTDGLSKTQVDKLGDRLRLEQDSDEDLVMLDAYRRSFAGTYEATVGVIHNVLKLATTGRPSKSTQSIRDKLQRESIRLSQIQDIAGCRIVVLNTEHQEEGLSLLIGALDHHGFRATILDRRVQPSHGYRAVHVICHTMNRWIEIQIRTELQHVWAQISEKLSDMVDPAIKYGQGPPRLKNQLERFSNHISQIELEEKEIWRNKEYAREEGLEETPEQIKIANEVEEWRVATRNALYQAMGDILRVSGEITD